MLLLERATCGEERPAIAGVIPQADLYILQDGEDWALLYISSPFVLFSLSEHFP
jgi:hypothetical protein